MTNNEMEAIAKLKQTALQCHKSDCWEKQCCSDCYVEIEDILAIDIVLKLVDKLQMELEQEQYIHRCDMDKYFKLMESYNRLVEKVSSGGYKNE